MIKYHIGFVLVVIIGLSSCNNNNNGNTGTQDIGIDTLKEIVQPIVNKRFGVITNNYTIAENTIQKNEFFSNILQNNGISYARVLEAIDVGKEIFDVKYMHQGNKYYTFNRNDSTNKTDYIIYHLNKTNYIKFDFIDSIEVSEHQLPIRIDINIAEGEINSSLWISFKNAGFDPMLSMELSDIYAWTIDFYGLQKGDRFKVVYQKRYIDSTYIGLGKVLSCQFIHSGHDYKAYIFTQDSLEDYFDEEGGSLRRTFLKAPLKFSRISSRFSHSRMHPILKIRRPHHGVDYAAPTGTPVHTIGDGKITYIGRKGGYGKYVKIKHNGTYTSGYAHLSRYGKGMKVGDFVKQGITIGYVGTTGRSTGPHLDFRVYKDGTPIDPLKMKSPPAVPIKDSLRTNFNLIIKYYDNIMK